LTAQELLNAVLKAGGRIIPDPARPRLLVPADLKPLVAEHRDLLRALVLARAVQDRSPHPSASNISDPPGRLEIERADGEGSGDSAGQESEELPHLLSMPLGVFAREGQLLEVRVPYLAQTLWFVPGESDAEGLTQEGISRGRIWTARELADLLSCAGLSPNHVKAVALAKIELGGDVVEVRRR